MRQHVDPALVDERSKLRPLAPELVGDMAKRLVSGWLALSTNCGPFVLMNSGPPTGR